MSFAVAKRKCKTVRNEALLIFVVWQLSELLRSLAYWLIG